MSRLAVAGSLVTAGGYIYANNEAHHPVVDRIQIPLKDLHPALEGFTIAVLADFHLFPLTQLELIRKAVAMTNALESDLAVLLGDYVWRDVEAIFDLAPALAGLNARHGVFSILGNHDHRTNSAVITQGLTRAGLPLLVNEGLPISSGEGILYLAGLDDGLGGKPDFQSAMENLPAEAPTILLVHEPDLADRYSLDNRVILQLSGHSHGGQIRFPKIGALILPYLGWKYDFGLYKVHNMWLYTNRGLGVTNVPVRYNCPPEITEITLVRL